MTDLLIVLGCGKYESCRRARYAARLAKQGNFPIIVAGGFSDKVKTNSVPESFFMEKSLLENGIEQKRIIAESNSYDTYSNLACSRTIVEKMEEDLFDNHKVFGIVTGKCHATRTLKYAREIFYCYQYTPRIEVHSVPLISFQGLVTESISFIWERVHELRDACYEV